jgi:hypothetical protein
MWYRYRGGESYAQGGRIGKIHSAIAQKYKKEGIMSRILKKIVKAARERRGSTIVAVMAALTFITVVTSIMVKNTGSQSAASMGYGTAMTMHSTVNSGIMATEAVFRDPSKAGASGLDNVLNGVVNGTGTGTLIGGTGSNKMTSLGNSSSGQFFNSKLQGKPIPLSGENRFLAAVNVNAGAKTNGKSLKRGMAFFMLEDLIHTEKKDPIIIPKTCPTQDEPKVVDGIAINSTTTSDTNRVTTPKSSPRKGSGSNNAVYMEGKLQDGNNGMEVLNGGATFVEEVKFQNKEAVFHGEVFFQQDVYFLSNPGFVFYGNTYFNSNVIFQNQKSSCQLFKTPAGGTPPNVGVNRTVLADNTEIQMPGDFYINGNLGGNNCKIKGLTGGKKFYYTNNFSSSYINETYLGATFYAGKNKMDNNSDIPKRLNMKSLEERKETPFLEYNDLIKRITDAIGGAGNIVDVSNVTDGSKLNVSKLTNKYNTTAANKLYEGHLVVMVPFGKTLETLDINKNNDVSTTFDKKVIFIVQGKLTSNGGFYRCLVNSSTMIYVGPTGELEQLGSNSDFRGYILIDKNNTSKNNGFNWASTGHLIGAFHNFSTQPFKWNTGNGDNPMKITYDEAILAPFFTLKLDYVPGSIAGGNTDIDDEGFVDGKKTTTMDLPESVQEPNADTKITTRIKIVTVTEILATEIKVTTIKITTVVTETKSFDIIDPDPLPPCDPDADATVIPGKSESFKTGTTFYPSSRGYYFW